MAATRGSSRYWLVLVALCVASAPAALGYRTVGELMEAADVVVHGKVTRVEKTAATRVPGPEARLAGVTAITAEVVPYEVFKGKATAPLRVSALEGMEDSPEFVEGQEVILFLQRDAGERDLTTVGLLQGKLDVVDGVVTRNAMALPAFLDKLRELARD